MALTLAVVALADAYPRLFVIDDGQPQGDLNSNNDFFKEKGGKIGWESLLNNCSGPLRIRRDDKYEAAASDAYAGGYKKGIVGPVYTFVKTDPKANFKWGVRHRAGVQYAG